MTTRVLPQPVPSSPTRWNRTRSSVAAALTVWFVVVVSLGAEGAFVGRPGSPPLGMAIGIGAPLLIFFAWLRLSATFRDFILSLDLRVITAIQAWRFAGLGFLFLYAFKLLPGVFALPAGLGDMAIGITAPWAIFALADKPGFAASAAFRRWNLLGILDLGVAIGIGTASAMLATPGGLSTAAMASLPLLLVPVFLVPFFLMLHATALMQSRLPE